MAELIEKLEAFLCMLGKDFCVYQVPDADCIDVNEWKLVFDSKFPIYNGVRNILFTSNFSKECALERSNNIEVNADEEV